MVLGIENGIFFNNNNNNNIHSGHFEILADFTVIVVYSIFFY